MNYRYYRTSSDELFTFTGYKYKSTMQGDLALHTNNRQVFRLWRCDARFWVRSFLRGISIISFSSLSKQHRAVLSTTTSVAVLVTRGDFTIDTYLSICGNYHCRVGHGTCCFCILIFLQVHCTPLQLTWHFSAALDPVHRRSVLGWSLLRDPEALRGSFVVGALDWRTSRNHQNLAEREIKNDLSRAELGNIIPNLP